MLRLLAILYLETIGNKDSEENIVQPFGRFSFGFHLLPRIGKKNNSHDCKKHRGALSQNHRCKVKSTARSLQRHTTQNNARFSRRASGERPREFEFAPELFPFRH